MNAMRGTRNLSAWRHTVSDCGSTPDTPSNTTTAPSSTRSERSTSIVKSTCPGVSIRWMSWLRQAMLVAAAVMVMPRSRSCGIQSICASPSWTSPILWMRPEWNRKRSVTVVLPASMWATMPMLRTRAILGGAAVFAGAAKATSGAGSIRARGAATYL